MIGLSKKDKEEIMEYPKTFGVILYGMHKDLGLMQRSITDYKDTLNRYIRYTKTLKDKFEFEIRKVRNEHEDVKVVSARVKDKLNSSMENIDSKMKSMDKLNNDFVRKYADFKERESLLEKAITANNKVIEQKIINIFTLFETSKSELVAKNIEVKKKLDLIREETSKSQEKIVHNSSSIKEIEDKIGNIYSLLEASKNEFQQNILEVHINTALTQEQISVSRKEIRQNRVAMYVLGILLVVSSIFHFI